MSSRTLFLVLVVMCPCVEGSPLVLDADHTTCRTGHRCSMTRSRCNNRKHWLADEPGIVNGTTTDQRRRGIRIWEVRCHPHQHAARQNRRAQEVNDRREIAVDQQERHPTESSAIRKTNLGNPTKNWRCDYNCLLPTNSLGHIDFRNLLIEH